MPLHQRQHDRLFDGNRRQFVAFLFDVPLRSFLPQQLGEIVGVDADQLAKSLFQQISQCRRGNLRQKRRTGFHQFRLTFLRIEIEVV